MKNLRVESKALGNVRSLWIREPGNPAGCTNLMVFLDAEYYREGVGAPAIIETLVSSGAIADAWVVFVSHHSAAARWVECPCNLQFSTFVGTELLPFLEARFPELKSVLNRTLVGLSYTGLAASHVVLEFPGAFTKCISQSGSYWSNDCWLIGEYARRAPSVLPDFFLDVGDAETETDLTHNTDLVQRISQIEGVEEFRDVLVSLGSKPVYRQFKGGHGFEGWAGHLPTALAWALPSVKT